MDTNTSISGAGHSTLLARVQAAGIELIRDGEAWVGACPFHQDAAQSLLVDPSHEHWQCDGDCQTGGDTVDWIMRTEHVSRSHAQELLRQGAPASSGLDLSTSRTTVRRLDSPFDPDDDDTTLLQKILGFYRASLADTPHALSYLHSRGICQDAVDDFQIGFSNRKLGYLLPEKNRKAGAALRGRLQRLGVLKPSGHELFRGSIVVPIINDGRIVQVYGRKVGDHHRPGTPLHTFLHDAPHGVFNLDALKISDEVILCASVFDALTFWCQGYRNVTGCSGLERVSDEHLVVFEQFGVKRVLLAFRADTVGDGAASAWSDRLTAIGIDTYRVELPSGQDVNAFACVSDAPAGDLGDAIRKAVWWGKGETPVSPRPVQPADSTRIDAHSECVSESVPETISPTVRQEDATEITDVPEPIEAVPPNTVLPASVIPPPVDDLPVECKDQELIASLEDRRYRIRGLEKNHSHDCLKVNILVSRHDTLHVDTFDLYATKRRAAFCREAAFELGVSEDQIKQDLNRLLLKLEVLQDQQIQAVLKPHPPAVTMTEKARNAAMGLLTSPRLVEHLLEDFARCGVVGERTNLLVSYLATLSRKLDRPLAVIVQSSSAAGKSALMDAVMARVPDEDRVQYSAMTGQSLFYMGNVDLRHKILAISEEEGASQAAYALKLLQSDGRLTIASTGKDANSGRHVTHEYRVDGPVMLFSTTTALDIDEELLNRCLVLTVDEGRDQTQAIHQWQRHQETLEGLMTRQTRDDILTLHRNAQRLLKPLRVVNPYADRLTFQTDKTRARRDHPKYLTLIKSIALLHQYQREQKTAYLSDRAVTYIEVTPEDIALANQLAHDVLGRSLDELAPQTRNLLSLIDRMVTVHCAEYGLPRQEYHFTRKTVRDYSGWGNTQLKIHLQRLEACEYLMRLRGGRGQTIQYELLYQGEGQDGSPFTLGLVDTKTLVPVEWTEADVTEDRVVAEDLEGLEASDAQTDVNGRPQVGAKSAQSRSEKTAENPHQTSPLAAIPVRSGKKRLSGKTTPPIVTVPPIPPISGSSTQGSGDASHV